MNMNAYQLSQNFSHCPRRFHAEVARPHHGAYVYNSDDLTLYYGDVYRIWKLQSTYKIQKPVAEQIVPRSRPERVINMAVKGYDRHTADLKCEFATLVLAEAAGFNIDKIRKCVRGQAITHLDLIWKLADDEQVDVRDLKTKYSAANRGKANGEKRLSERVANLIPKVIELSKTLNPGQVAKKLDLHPRTVKRIIGRQK